MGSSHSSACNDPLAAGVARLESSNVQDNAALMAKLEGLAVTKASLVAAAKRVKDVAIRTPVMTCSTLDKMVAMANVEHPKDKQDFVDVNDKLAVDNMKDKQEIEIDDVKDKQEINDVKDLNEVKLYFKCENLQKIGAFKIRGALNAVGAALEERSGDRSSMSVVTESSGNHGQAVAMACRMHGCKATVVMPKDAPQAKVDAVLGYGAAVERVAPEDRQRAAEKLVASTGAIHVHPSNDPLVMSGQGTVMIELFEQVEAMKGHLDAVIVSVGGGGLMSGVAVAAKILNPSMLVLGAEPAAADDAFRSLESGELQGHREGKVPTTIADGLRSSLGSNTWPVVRELVDEIITVDETEIAEAMRLVYERMKLVIEPSAAVGLAALLKPGVLRMLREKHKTKIKSIGLVFTGGNVTLTQPLAFQPSF